MAGGGRDPPAGTAINEALNQIAQIRRSERALEPPSASHILPADPGEIGNHLARVSITEDKPWVAFVGHPVVGLNGKPDAPQGGYHAMKTRKLAIGPVSPIGTHIGQTHDTIAHFSPRPSSSALVAKHLPASIFAALRQCTTYHVDVSSSALSGCAAHQPLATNRIPHPAPRPHALARLRRTGRG